MKQYFLKIKVISSLLILAIFLSTCAGNQWGETEEDCENFNINSCETVRPAFGKLKIKLSYINSGVPITIYRGYVEDSSVVYSAIISASSIEIEMPVNYKYSVSARYMQNGKIIQAIDGTEIERKSTIQCEYTCWEVTGGEINVELR